ncbi:MAG TPA: hypothetical protein VGL62_16475 [Vicinamibacterales bacterium]|jgi:hypothetical protein
MRRQFFFGTVLAAALAVGLGAQAQDPTTSAQAGSHDNGPGAGMMSGCVAPLNQSDAGLTGATGSTATETTSKARNGSDRFTLIDIKMGPSPSSGDVMPTADQKVLLEGSNLQRYSGHRVEVSGRWLDVKGNASTGTTGSTAGSDEHADQHNMRTFRVTSVRNVDGACSTSGR